MSLCDKLYLQESFNVKPKGQCVEVYNGTNVQKHWSRWNNADSCAKNGGTWTELWNYLEKAPRNWPSRSEDWTWPLTNCPLGFRVHWPVLVWIWQRRQSTVQMGSALWFDQHQQERVFGPSGQASLPASFLDSIESSRYGSICFIKNQLTMITKRDHITQETRAKEHLPTTLGRCLTSRPNRFRNASSELDTTSQQTITIRLAPMPTRTIKSKSGKSQWP